MYAIVRDRSRNLTLRPGQELWIDHLPGAEPGGRHVFEQVSLLSQEDGSAQLGRPFLEGAKVVAEVLGEAQGEKIRVYFYRRRKNSRRTHGHRQVYTRIRVQEIQGA
ncbi:MAG: 50S ribosomal protein L21 [Planctomycetota bacterium]|nr:MAG: 50S ribosomal protein L21 [Planctomycetota bacterium]